MMSLRKQMELEPNFIPARKSKKKVVYSIIYYIVGTTLSLFFILPLLYMVAASTKTPQAIAFSEGNAMMFIPDFSNMGHFLDNYAKVLIDREIWKNALNSLIYAAIIIVFNILVNGLAGYVLAKFDFPGKGFFNFIILFLIVVPVETSIIPLWYIARRALNLKEGFSILAMVLPSIISVFNIFLFTQFFSSIPKEYEEAMHIDGSSRVRIFFDLILPLSKPIIATTVVFSFIGVWNDYVWPQMVLPHDWSGGWDLLTIQVAINEIQTSGDLSIHAGVKMASLVITTLPIFIIYTAAQKYIVKGFGTAGLKM